MTQVPLAPPPSTGQPIDGWLFLLWKRLTATGQQLWSTIVPGTSADVAAVVTDETGSPGSLVFSGNPTLAGVTVNGLAYVGDTTAPAGQTQLNLMVSTNTVAGSPFLLRKSCDALNGPNLYFLKSRGTAASPAVVVADDATGTVAWFGFDGTNYTNSAQILAFVDGSVSTGIVPTRLRFLTANSSGVLSEGLRIDSAQVVTLGGLSTAPALKVTPIASQARWVEVTGALTGGNPTIGTSGGDLSVASATGYFKNTAVTTSTIYSIGGTGSATFVAQAPTGQVAAYQFLIAGAETARITSTANGMILATGPSVTAQVGIVHTASANRYITLTGSNGGNPTIGTSGGCLYFSVGTMQRIAVNNAATLTITDAYYSIIQTNTASVYTLPAAASYVGRILKILNVFGGAITSASSDVQPITGGSAGTAILSATSGKWAELQSNGTSWHIIAAN